MKRRTWTTTVAALAILAPTQALRAQEYGATDRGGEVEALAEYMDRMARAGFSGVALVARGDRILLAEGYGLADRERGIPATPETVFSMGSITKLFTATAVLNLAQEGRLSLGDSLASYYPDAPLSHRSITVEQLLTHASGLGELPARDVDPVGRDEMERRAFASELIAPPGDRYRYSNLGYSLLGALVEKVSGREYEEYLRNELLVPAGIYETGYVLPRWGSHREVVGYSRGKRWGTLRERWTRPEGPYWILRANGGLHTTAFDVLRWVRATLRPGTIFDAGGVRALTRPRVRITDTVHQALGWLVDTSAGTGPILRHAGGNGIFSANVRHSTGSELTVITFSNVAELPAEVLSVALEKMARGEEVGMPPTVEPAASATPDAIEALAGSWQVEGRGILSLRSRGDHLELTVEGQALVELLLAADSSESARLRRLNRQARNVWEGVAEGDFGPARSIFPGPDPPERPFESFLAGMARENGPLRELEVLGTAPVWYASPYASWLRLRFGDRTLIRRIHWSEEGRYAGLGGSVYPAPLVLRCVLLARGGCAGIHLLLPLGDVRVIPGSGDRGVLEAEGRSYSMTRLPGADEPGMMR